MRLPGWAFGLALLLLAAYGVPYLALSGAETWRGAFLFWCAFGVVVWALLVAVVCRWRVGPGGGSR
ncbi:hypothetical protein BH23PSE1_BH23PSE1_19270 [soil metagenome]